MPSPEELWKRMDSNGDGSISPEEFAAMPRVQNLPEDKRQMLFKRLDKDGDGKIARGELQPPGDRPDQRHKMPLPPIWELDKDKDGGVSFEEFKNGPMMKRLAPERQQRIFSRLDSNGDGKLTPQDRPQPPGPGGRRDDGERPEPPPWKRPERGEGPGGGWERPGEGGPRRPNPRAMIQMLDSDQDGSVTLEEFQQAPRMKDMSDEARREKFNDLDRNHDGKLNRADFPAPEEVQKLKN